MASVILSRVGATAGATIGENIGGPIGAYIGARIGSKVGSTAGSFIDNTLFGTSRTRNIGRDTHLEELALQTSAYGKMIPIVYGTVRIAGNLMWAEPIAEHVTTTTSGGSVGGGKGGGGHVSTTTNTYSYTVSLAIAVCEGPIDAIYRIWADAELLNLSQYTLSIYLGSETQTPDPFMQSFDGAAATPAYRGMAYVVFHDFPLADFGNRIPNFTFEVQRKMQYADWNGQVLENMVGAAILIPGAGEFVYDTTVEYKVPGATAGAGWAQTGAQTAINMNNASGKADALLALDQFQATCPNAGWVGVVVTWFGNNMDAGSCTIQPGVEYQTGATTQPDAWSVAGFNRATAYPITMVGGSPRYGGTPDDASVLHLLTELRNRGFKIMFYPMLFMDVSGKPWRGNLTGSPVNVANFFTKTNGYNAFINHYVSLVNGYVDAFVIGSELKGLTAVTDTPGSYPAVSALVSLAASVKSTLGSGVKVTYAADWSEYHHTAGGYYNLDPLWASPNIDVVGIDAYFPLTNGPQDTTYNIQNIINGWTSGEGYDFYYTDPGRTITAPLSAPFAWKNIAWWWSNTHTNPGGATTAWVPGSKKIWFTEFGFPSVDCATNQPNVFYDPASSGSAFPYFSKGRVDFRAQRAGLTATEAQWSGSSMVERMFMWTWDARPYPYFPDLLSVWADGGDWQYGHWATGKLGVSSLAAIVADLCGRAGLASTNYDVSAITNPVNGFFITAQETIRASIESLQLGYFFDAAETDYVLKFIPRGGSSVQSVPETDIVPVPSGQAIQALAIARKQELELPKRVNVVYLNRLSNYQTAAQYSQRGTTGSRQLFTVNLPIVLPDQTAKTIADVTLYSQWVGRNVYRVRLPVKYLCLEPADVITVTANNVAHTMRVTGTSFVAPGVLQVDAVGEDISAYNFYTPPGASATGTAQGQPVAATLLEFLDIPALPGDAVDQGVLRFAAAGTSANWSGAALYRSDDGGSNYNHLLDIPSAAVIGSTLTVLPSGITGVFDIVSTVSVSLVGSGQLASATQRAVLNGANLALIGSEIVQFTTATLTSPGQYTLSGFLRGRMGTEWAMGLHVAGEPFVLISGLVARQTMSSALIGLLRAYKPVSVGSTLTATAENDFTYAGVALKPYAPVHITGVRDGSGNLTISWVRRTRVSGEWQAGVDVPLNEASEAYQLDVYNGSSVVRTISGLSSPTASYTAAQQTTDFGSTQSSVSVKVYQMSAIIGRGYAGQGTV